LMQFDVSEKINAVCEDHVYKVRCSRQELGRDMAGT
jgi:hypothetical protein